MPNSHVPILTLSGQCEPSTSDYLIHMINAIARSAFGRPINCSATHLGQQDHNSVLLSLPPLSEHEDSLELALRLGEALFRELGSLCQELGVRFKYGAPPSRQALQITGLTRHQLRLKFVTFWRRSNRKHSWNFRAVKARCRFAYGPVVQQQEPHRTIFAKRLCAGALRVAEMSYAFVSESD